MGLVDVNLFLTKAGIKWIIMVYKSLPNYFIEVIATQAKGDFAM